MYDILHNPVLTIISLTCCGGLTGALVLVVFRIWGSIANSWGEKVKAFVPFAVEEQQINYGALPGEDLAWMGLPKAPIDSRKITGPLPLRP